MTNDPLIHAIKERREAANLSQEQVADLIGVSLKTYQRIERGETEMKLSHYRSLLKKLKATHLDIALDMLAFEKATPWDVAAAARTLPPEIRTVLVSLIMMIYRDKTQ